MAVTAVEAARHVAHLWTTFEQTALLDDLLAQLDEDPATTAQAAQSLAMKASTTTGRCVAMAVSFAARDTANPTGGHSHAAFQWAAWAAAWAACGDQPREADRGLAWDHAWTAERHWQTMSELEDMVKQDPTR